MKDRQLKVNGQVNPLNIDLTEPILVTWKVVGQTSYSLELLDDKQRSLFKVEENSIKQEQQIDLPNHSERRGYTVRLVCYKEHQEIAQISGEFYTKNHELQQANWITRLDNPIEKENLYFNDKPNIILKKQVELKGTSQAAFIDICGLGYYTLKINGHRISDAYLNSDVTSYDQRIYYDTYRIDDYLVVGKNTFTVELANGWYNPAPILILGKYNIRKQLAIGKPTMICDIRIEMPSHSERIISDTDWKSSCGPFLQNDLYIGEVFTDQIMPTANVREQTVCISGPTGELVPSFISKITRQEKIVPHSIIENEQGWVIDFGQIISGQLAFTLPASMTGIVEITYGEAIDETNQLDYASTISGTYGQLKGKEFHQAIIQKDQIIKKRQKALSFSNQYTYHSFRYAFVKKQTNIDTFPLEEVHAYRIFSAVEVITEFDSSSDKLNQLWQAALNTRQNNMHSYFEDCTRERFGYGGDVVALLSSHVATSNIKDLVKKVFLDFVDAQIADGGIPQTAPFVGIMTNGPSNNAGSLGWQLVLPTLAQSLCENYHEKAFVQQYQNILDKHIQYLLRFDFSFIRTCCLGDWGAIDSQEEDGVISSPDQSFCTGCMYVILLTAYLKLIDEGIIPPTHFASLNKKMTIAKKTLLEDFNVETGDFAGGTLSSDIFAIQAGLVVEEDRERQMTHLINKIKENDTIFSFGIFGMSWAYEILSEAGENQLIYDWLMRENSPSYYDMLKTGNAALAEYFPIPTQKKRQSGSLNHAMFSSYSNWFVKALLGLQLTTHQLVIHPAIDLPIEWISGSIKTEVGKVAINYQKMPKSIVIEVRIPKELPYVEKISQNYEHSECFLIEGETEKVLTIKVPIKKPMDVSYS